MTSVAQKRSRGELQKLLRDNAYPDFLTQVGLQNSNVFKWFAVVKGPAGSPYGNGHFVLSVELSEAYPHEAPRVTFLTKVFSMHVTEEGKLCEAILDQWAPTQTIEDALQRVASIVFDCSELAAKNSAPVNETAAALYERSRDEYIKKCTASTNQFATEQLAKVLVERLEVQ